MFQGYISFIASLSASLAAPNLALRQIGYTFPKQLTVMSANTCVTFFHAANEKGWLQRTSSSPLKHITLSLAGQKIIA